MDRRTTPFSGRIALNSLEGSVKAEAFTAGAAACITAPIADLRSKPQGSRDRQLIFGDLVLTIDQKGEWTFLQSQKDGYCGWVHTDHLGPATTPTHWVCAKLSHLYPEPRVQSEASQILPFGALLSVNETVSSFAKTPFGFVPVNHIKKVGHFLNTPIEVAIKFLGTPYLWGGNSALGIDCSGLVQAAYLACGIPCPADSDLQAQSGTRLDETAVLKPGDLLFWKGHVAIVCGPDLLIHANGHSMDVRTESITDCRQRILASGGGQITARVRYRENLGLIQSAE